MDLVVGHGVFLEHGDVGLSAPHLLQVGGKRRRVDGLNDDVTILVIKSPVLLGSIGDFVGFLLGSGHGTGLGGFAVPLLSHLPHKLSRESGAAKYTARPSWIQEAVGPVYTASTTLEPKSVNIKQQGAGTVTFSQALIATGARTFSNRYCLEAFFHVADNVAYNRCPCGWL